MAVHGSALAKNGGMRPWATVAYSRWLLEQAAAEESDAELNFVEAELLRLFLHLFMERPNGAETLVAPLVSSTTKAL